MSDQPCKICETRESITFNFFPEVCDNCAKYDWGYWRVGAVNQAGFFLGCAAAFLWVLAQDLSGYAHPMAIGMFTMLIGGAVGAAFVAGVGSWLLEHYLMQPPREEDPRQLAQEAEKFFYVGLLSAFQGKTEYALRMLRQARLHGWDHWDRLTGDPRFRAFCNHKGVKHILSH